MGHPNRAHLWLGGPEDKLGAKNTWHPECVVVMLWDETAQSYHGKVYVQYQPEPISDEERDRRRKGG